MPEGDTIFRAARTLHRALAGQTVTGFDTAYAQLARVHDDAPITGRTVEGVTSYGKHLVMRFSGDLALRTHMRMHGSWHIYRPGERWQRPRSAMRVVIETAPFIAVGFDIPDAEFVRSSKLGERDVVARLGPDLLSAEFDAEAARARLRARGDQPIAEALLDQHVMAGVGNVFKSEILFEGGVHPRTPVGVLSDERLAGLIAIARKQLAMNVRAAPRPGGEGGRRTTGRLAPEGGLWVYGRRGEPCRRCGTLIASEKQGVGARITYWCPRCQPA